MRHHVFILVFLLAGLCLKSQSYFHVYGGYSSIDAKEWNRSVQAFNYARPWLTDQLKPLNSGVTAGMGFTGAITRGLFLGPELQYSRFVSEASNDPFSVNVRLNVYRGTLNADIYPFEFDVDSVEAKTRPFIRIGAGATLYMPKVTLSDSVVFVGDEVYDPLVWTFHYNIGAGCRISLSNRIELMPMLLYSRNPSVNLEDFNIALHGTTIPQLTNANLVNNWQFLIGISIKIKKANDEYFERD